MSSVSGTGIMMDPAPMSYFAVHNKRSTSARRSPPIPDLLIDPLHNSTFQALSGYNLPPSPVSPRASNRPSLNRTSSSKYDDMLYVNTHFSRGSEFLHPRDAGPLQSTAREDRDMEELLAATGNSLNLGNPAAHSSGSSTHANRLQTLHAVSEAKAYSEQIREALSLTINSGGDASASASPTVPPSTTASAKAPTKRLGLVKAIGGSLRSTGSKMKKSTGPKAHLSTSSLPRSLQMPGPLSSVKRRTSTSSSQLTDATTDPDRVSDCASVHSSTSMFVRKPKVRKAMPFSRSRPSTAPSDSEWAAKERFNTFPRSMTEIQAELTYCPGRERRVSIDEVTTPPMSASPVSSTFHGESRRGAPAAPASGRNKPHSKFRLSGSHSKMRSIGSLPEDEDLGPSSWLNDEVDWEKTLERAAATASWNSSINHRPRSHLPESRADIRNPWSLRQNCDDASLHSLEAFKLHSFTMPRHASAATGQSRPSLTRAVSDFTLTESRKNSYCSASYHPRSPATPSDAVEEDDSDPASDDQDWLGASIPSGHGRIPLQLGTGFDVLAMGRSSYRNSDLARNGRAVQNTRTSTRAAAKRPDLPLSSQGEEEMSRKFTVPDVPEAVTSESSEEDENNEDEEEENEDDETYREPQSLPGLRRRSSTIRQAVPPQHVPGLYNPNITLLIAAPRAVSLLQGHSGGQSLIEAEMWVN